MISMGRTKLVQHVNRISGWEHPEQIEVFCKAKHKILPAEIETCEGCPYFVTAGQGDVIVCAWEDIPPLGGDTRVVHQSDVTKEFYRVSRMIDDGIIKKG